MKKAIEQACEDLKMLLNNHLDEIESAYLQGEEDLGVSIPARIEIKPGPSIGSYEVRTRMSFVETRVRDEMRQVVDKNQLKLDLEKTK